MHKNPYGLIGRQMDELVSPFTIEKTKLASIVKAEQVPP